MGKNQINMTPIVTHEFQVNKPNGDIDFIEVEDLPLNIARKFVENKYPDRKIQFYKTYTQVRNTLNQL
jgi:hypothetical protein